MSLLIPILRCKKNQSAKVRQTSYPPGNFDKKFRVIKLLKDSFNTGLGYFDILFHQAAANTNGTDNIPLFVFND